MSDRDFEGEDRRHHQPPQYVGNKRVVEYVTHNGWGVPQIVNAVIGLAATVVGGVAVALIVQSMHEKQSQHDSMIEMQTNFKSMSAEVTLIHLQLNSYTTMSTEIATMKAELSNAEKLIDAQSKRIQDLEAMRRLR